MFERSEEVLLEAEVGELALLNELHGQLSERVDREEGDVFVRVATHLKYVNTSDLMTSHVSCKHLVEVVADDLPDA